jgi:NIMA-interacting peptidyl-prolyl cis-trans isomerase 1
MKGLTLGALGLALVAGCGGPQAAAVAPAPSADPTATVAAPSTSSRTLIGDIPANPPDGAGSSSSARAKTDAAATISSARAGSTDRPAQISARHVLIQWMGAQSAGASVVRTREQARSVAEDVLRKAKSGVDFARLAVEFSDEPGAGHRGGSLGRFGHGQMVKQFEDAAFALQPNEISGIVESPFGFHIIQRTE